MYFPTSTNVYLYNNKVHEINIHFRYNRVYSKVANHWTAVARKVPKDYSYMVDIMSSVIKKVAEEGVVLRGKASVSVDDPRKIAATIAPTTPPPTREIVEQMMSRFPQESLSGDT